MSFLRISKIMMNLRPNALPFAEQRVTSLRYHRSMCKSTQTSAAATSKAPRRPGFGSIETREDFRKLFGRSIQLPLRPDEPSQAGLTCTTQVVDEAVSYLISTELAPALALSRSVLRVRNEKARYLVIYEILKGFAKLARGRLILEARSVQEALADEEQQDGEDTDEDALLVGFEETLGDARISGPVEFLVYTGSDVAESGPIRFVCEVKPSLELYWGKATWQFLAQLTTAAQTWGSEEVYGALTDALEWHFFRIQKLPDNKWAIQAAMPLVLANSKFDATDESTSAVTMLLQSLFPNKTDFSLQDLTGSLKAADDYITVWSQTFTERAGRSSKIQRKDAEIQRYQAENQKLKAELEKTKK